MLDLNKIRALRQAGQHEEARQMLVQMSAQFPQDAVLNYEAACVHDFLGFERQAIPYYLTAIQNGLAGSDLRGAYLGLGSTYRALGMAAESKQTFLEGLAHFPEAAEIKVFLAMTLFNLGDYQAAVSSLLDVIADTTADPHTKHYQRAIRLYAEDLNRRWD
jgi:tetratricopeptide (TPR) repeat protein